MYSYSYRSAEAEAYELQQIIKQGYATDYQEAEARLESQYVPLREASSRLQEQNQYVARYLEGLGDKAPDLGKGIRYGGDPADYHGVKIHEDDVAIFVARILTHREAVG